MYSQTRTLVRAATRGIIIASCFAAVSAHAITVKVKVENVSKYDGLWFTPVFFGFHDGSFDTFDSGVAATSSIEALAEGGDTSGLVGDIAGVTGAKSHVLEDNASAAIGGPAVLFSPGESNYFTVDLDAVLNRYLSFATMILPSNDSFLGNSKPGYELFDILGNFNGAQEINLFASNIWDAGTEENDFIGAPLSPLPGMSTDTIGGSVSLLGQSGLNGFNGRELAVGTYLSNDLMVGDQVARISVQQVPDSTQYIGFMGAIALIGFRFMTKKRMGEAAE